MKWPLLCGLLGLALICPAQATDDLYLNDANVSYPGTASYPPVVDATNFVNSSSFAINFPVLSLSTEFYETLNTLNYTNFGTMVVNSGFRFDTQTTNVIPRQMAGSFFNSGTISCGSVIDSSFFFLNGFFFFGEGQFIAWATNIANPGTVNVGADGLMQFTGQNVDLTRSSLTIEGISANTSGSGVFDLNTNAWSPAFNLTTNRARSAFFPVSPFVLNLTNSTAYFHFTDVDSNNEIIQAIFVQDNSGPGVTYSVHVGIPQDPRLGSGGVTIEWIGSLQDPVSGSLNNNYLYLNNDYILGASTNVVLINGIPDNFTFTASSTPISIGAPPVAAGFSPLPAEAITNRYAFGNIQLISTTVSTNDIANHSVTNLPGRIQISASKELDLSLAEITGMNYFSVQAMNQFDGSAGAHIAAPYSDISIGVTNGFLTVSNLMQSSIPNWSGNVQAWSTRWLQVDTVNGITNDFRVLIVGSQLSPATPSQVQDLILHGTNSIIISDAFNIMRKLSADAQNLTLTTNGAGVGATSLAGELNIEPVSIFWQSSFPNLRNLTNNGAIRTVNQANFGSPLVINSTPSISAVAATGVLARASSGVVNVAANDKLTIGTNRYAFVSKVTNSIANQVKVGATFDGSMSNLIAAINHGTGAGTNYSTNTHANPFVTAGTLANHAFTVTAVVAGASGNTNSTLTTSANLTWNGHSTLLGGVDFVLGSTNVVSFPYDNFINNGLVSDQSSVINAKNFLSSGVFSNGIGSFTLQSLTTTLTNGLLDAGGDVSITADSLVTSNLFLRAGRSLALRVTNLLTDAGVGNGNIWMVQGTNIPGGNGLIMPIKPLFGDLLGTTISNTAAAPNKQVVNIWAGQDRGVSVNGYTNNAAIGRLILDAAGLNSSFKFSGAGVSNALYVDYLEFRDAMTNGINNSYDFTPNLPISTNLVIYFAQAVANDTSIAAKIDSASKAGRNGGRLRWIPAYAGYYSSVALVYPDGTTNIVNAALAASNVDSDGDGTANATDPSPLFTGSQINLNLAMTNGSPMKAVIKWNSIPGATNYVYYRTNLASPIWLTLTNFISPAIVPPVGGWPITNVLYDAVNPLQSKFYNIKVMPNSTLLYGP